MLFRSISCAHKKDTKETLNPQVPKKKHRLPAPVITFSFSFDENFGINITGCLAEVNFIPPDNSFRHVLMVVSVTPPHVLIALYFKFLDFLNCLARYRHLLLRCTFGQLHRNTSYRIFIPSNHDHLKLFLSLPVQGAALDTVGGQELFCFFSSFLLSIRVT